MSGECEKCEEHAVDCKCESEGGKQAQAVAYLHRILCNMMWAFCYSSCPKNTTPRDFMKSSLQQIMKLVEEDEEC